MEHIETTTHFPDHKIFIFNIIQKYKKENFRLETPNFTFKTPKGSDFRFSKLNGKPVYVQVFRTDCPDCIREMKLIEELKKTYDEKIEFVSILKNFDLAIPNLIGLLSISTTNIVGWIILKSTVCLSIICFRKMGI